MLGSCSSAGFARAINSGVARGVARFRGMAEPAMLEQHGGRFGRGATPPSEFR